MARSVTSSHIDLILRTRVTVLVTSIGAIGDLLSSGVVPWVAVIIVLVAVATGAEIGRRLTLPYSAPHWRLVVLVMIVVFIVNAVRLGFPPVECLLLVPAGVWCAALLARWAAGLALQPGTVPA